MTTILTFGKFKGQRFCDTPQWYQEWAKSQPSFMQRLTNAEPIPPKRPKYLDGCNAKSTAYELAQFEYEMAMADKYDPSDRYGHYEHL